MRTCRYGGAVEEVTKEALNLPLQQRLALAGFRGHFGARVWISARLGEAAEGD
ncbi:MAG: hypothetical protein ACR2ID_05820 [Chthoniobacterales bacterium]